MLALRQMDGNELKDDSNMETEIERFVSRFV